MATVEDLIETAKKKEELVKKVARDFSSIDFSDEFLDCEHEEPPYVLLSLKPYLEPVKRHNFFRKGYILN